MIVSDTDLLKEIDLGRIVISPFNIKHVNPNSYDLTLANTLLTYTERILDCSKENPTKETSITSDGYILWPGILYLGATVESVGSDKYVPILEGKSSLGRLGLDVHISAGLGDVGWNGMFTLELRVIHPLKIYAGQKICQIVFHSLTSPATNLYSGKYQTSKTVIASRSHKDF